MSLFDRTPFLRDRKHLQSTLFITRRTVLELQSNFIEITIPHVCSPVNLQDILKTSFSKNTYGGLLLEISQDWQFTTTDILLLPSKTNDCKKETI